MPAVRLEDFGVSQEALDGGTAGVSGMGSVRGFGGSSVSHWSWSGKTVFFHAETDTMI